MKRKTAKRLTKHYYSTFKQSNDAQKPMKQRKQEMFDMLIEPTKRFGGRYVNCLDENVLNELIKDGTVATRLEYRSRYKTRRKAYIVDLPEPVVEQIPEPYKKRRNDLKNAGLRYRKSF